MVFMLGVCTGRLASQAPNSEAPTRASDAPSRAPKAHSEDRCPEAVHSVKVPEIHFGATCSTYSSASRVETPAGSENEFDEELCFTKYRGVRMTVDEAYLAVLEEAQWRAENGPGAAYTESEAEYYDEQCRFGEGTEVPLRTKEE